MFDVQESAEYILVREFYGDKTAKRSGVPLINHIDEGVRIMQHLGCSSIAARAFCLHPLLQADDDLRDNYLNVLQTLYDVPGGGFSLLLAMEYRSVANAHLSHHIKPEGGIRLSPLYMVNVMLVADKVQNRKDFEIFHANTHERRNRLSEYFSEWLEALGISEDQYLVLCAVAENKE